MSIEKARFEALKATMPWTHQVGGHPQIGGLVRVVNNQGQEVDLFDMMFVLDVVTARLAKQENNNAQG